MIKKELFFYQHHLILKAQILKNLVPAFKISSGDNDNLILLNHIKNLKNQ